MPCSKDLNFEIAKAPSLGNSFCIGHSYFCEQEAAVIIWIVKCAQDEHRQAVEWLNQHTDENVGFFLLEIELWKNLYNHFLEQKAAIEEFLGEEITWHEASIDVAFGYDTYNADFKY